MTPELWAEVARRNARRSTGPRTEAGKARARLNALKHGLRAERVTLPHEPPGRAAAIAADWDGHYHPQSPAARHLLNECARARLLADRLDRYLAAAADQRMVDARLDLEDRRGAELDDRVHLWKSDPAAARAEFAESALGCDYVHQRWLKIGRKLDARARLSAAAAHEAVRLLGGKSGPGLKDNPGAWEVRLLTTLLTGTAKSTAIARLFDPAVQPESLRAQYRLDDLPRFDVILGRLTALIRAEETHWGERSSRLRAEEHEADSARTEALAFVPSDAQQARLELRYRSEARAAFHRAWKALREALAEDAERPESPAPPEVAPEAAAPEAAAPEAAAPEAAAPEAVPPASPNEASARPSDLDGKPCAPVVNAAPRPVPTAHLLPRWVDGGSSPRSLTPFMPVLPVSATPPGRRRSDE